jgi:hypothetical protein
MKATASRRQMLADACGGDPRARIDDRHKDRKRTPEQDHIVL